MKSWVETDNKGFPSGIKINDYSPRYIAEFIFNPCIELDSNTKYEIQLKNTKQPFSVGNSLSCRKVAVMISGAVKHVQHVQLEVNILQKEKVIAKSFLCEIKRIFFHQPIRLWTYAAQRSLSGQIYGLLRRYNG